MYDVVTIGSATRDAFFKVNFEIIPWSKTPSGRGYLLPLGEKLEVDDVFFTIGGNAVNASVTFARQGFKTACVSKTGCDVSGEEIKRRLKKEGVETRLLICISKRPTAYSVLLLRGGERTILGYHGASDVFNIRDIDLKKLKSKWWYLSLAGESDRMFKKLLKFAAENKVTVAFNPSGHHLHHKRQEILSLLRDLTFLVLNEEEAAALTGISFKKEREVFKKLDRLMPGILAVTSGRGGVTVSDGRFIYKAGIFKERYLVDRTGAGDAFGSGFTAGLMRRGFNFSNIEHIKPTDVMYVIRLASANATAVIERTGATEGIITRNEFEKPRWKSLKIAIRRI
jgi:sugar/nucleoside kinase (ribokinase family)